MRTKAITHTEAQRAAITAPGEGATRVTAGAGTGKTSVLVSRYIKLLREDGIPPERILALTFTLKAAAEMRHRIEQAVRDEMPEMSSRLHSAWIMNFHQFGYRLIKENAPLFVIDPGAGVVSPTDFKRIERYLAARFATGEIAGVPLELGKTTPPTLLDGLFGKFFKIACKCRSEMIPLSSLRESVRAADDDQYGHWIDAIIAIGQAHDAELVQRNLIDFSDMITVPARGLEQHASLRRRYVGRFDHILVDEFQDTSAAQNEFLRVLSGGKFERVTVVGDEKQSIYRWRDAKVENIRAFPGDARPLRDNFRSYQSILDLAYAFISRDEDFSNADEHGPLRASRGKTAHPVVVFHPPAGKDGKAQPDAKEIEAEALATWVRCLISGDAAAPLPNPAPGPDGALRPDDVTVLLRSLNEKCSRPEIEAAFEKHGIPYAIIGGANAAETRALDLLHAWLSILLPAVDVRELLTVLERAPYHLSDATLLELFGTRVKRHSVGHDWLDDAELERVTDPGARAALGELRDVRDDLRARWQTMEFGAFVDYVMTQSPVPLRLFEDQVMAETIQDLMGEVHELTDALAAQNELNLPAFLEHLRVAVDERKFREEGDLRFPPGRVRIMTIHQSKGLEFPAVAVAGIKPPSKRSDGFFLSREDGVFFSDDAMKDVGRGYDESDERTEEKRLELQENRCLHYVAMTRARDFLWVSSWNLPKGPNKDGELKPDHFRDIIECAQETDGVVVVHEVPVLEGKVNVTSDAGAEATRAGALAHALEARDAVHKRLAAMEASAGIAEHVLAVNWTALLSFDSCPKQFHYAYATQSGALALTGDATARTANTRDDDLASIRIPGGIDPAAYGVLVHRTLEEWAATPREAPEAIVKRVAEQSNVGSDKVIEGALRLVTAVATSNECAPGEELRLEENFQVRRGGVTFHGVIDRLEKATDGWLVTDYKIGVPKDDYAFQASFYAWAVGRITGEPVAGRVVYVREDGVKAEAVTSPEAITRVGDVVDALAVAVSAGGWEASPGEPCGACAYRGVCSSALVASSG